jgi:hypothetical protein
MLGQTFEVMSKPYLDLNGTLNYVSTKEQLQQLIVYSLVNHQDKTISKYFNWEKVLRFLIFNI